MAFALPRTLAPVSPERSEPWRATVFDTVDANRISTALIRDALAAARLNRLQIDAILARAGAPAALLATPGAAVSLDQFGEIWRGVIEETGDEIFGLDPRGMPRGSFAVLCQTALDGRTLEGAIQRSLQFLGVLLSDFQARLVCREGRARIEVLETGAPRPALFHLTVFLMLTGLFSWLLDRRLVIDQATLRSLQPAAAANYRRLLCDGLEFGAPATVLSFDAKFLAMRPNRTEAQLQGFLARSPATLLVQYRSCDSLPGRIWSLLRGSLPEAWPTFGALASLLNTTPSTLRRRLDAANNSYQKIKDGVRQEMAAHALSLTRQPVTEIAKDLGYEDPSAFYRAFKKWTGLTPNAYRASNLAGEADAAVTRIDGALRTASVRWREPARG